MKRIFRLLLAVIALFILVVPRATATHIYGTDFFYTHISGNIYKITLVVYGDCEGASFSSLPTSSPEVLIIDDTTLMQTISLIIENPANGLEVTPVCPAQLNNTKCVNLSSIIPGVKKFVYSTNINLGATSAKWKFRFTGLMQNQTSAGRSGNIDNILLAGSSLMVLEATLNNIAGPNSSPTYTTIPTPFFCVQKPANYNPGTVDPNNDALTYALVPGLEPGGTVTYLPKYSATQPLSVVPGTFSFNTGNGQLSFTPDSLKSCLVVNRVSEYRNGVLVGTSMREMTFVTQLTCNNNPPQGNISNPLGGNASNGTTITVCRSAGIIGFKINPTDSDGHAINVAWSGIPSGASFNVTGNNTSTPSGTFSWNVINVAAGTYNFFITYTDNGCPLTSKQTQAYSIVVLPDPPVSFAITSAATCTVKAAFILTHNAAGPWRVQYYKGTQFIDSASSSNNTIADSLHYGTYTFRIFNNLGCYRDTTIIIPIVIPTLANIGITNPTCNKYSNGVLNVTAYNSIGPYGYAIDTGAYFSSGIFAGLPAGTYVIHIKDAPGCIKDTVVTLTDSLKVTSLVDIEMCHGNTGIIRMASSGGAGSYMYSVNNGPLDTVKTFTNLVAGNYILHSEDNLGCFFDTTLTLVDPPAILMTAASNNIDCHGNANGQISLLPSGGMTPYLFNINGGAYSASGVFTNLGPGNYTVAVKDAYGCIVDSTLIITQPPVLYFASLHLFNPRCYGASDGTVVAKGAGGTVPYLYATGSLPYTSSASLDNLPAGNHTIYIKDANGCITDTSITLTQPDAIASMVELIKPTCTPKTNGSISVLATGGVSPYSYSLGQNGLTNNNIFSSLGSGVYTVNIRDNNGCLYDTLVHLDDSLKILGNVTIKHASCYGMNDGEISVAPNGGVEPYRVAIDDNNYQKNFTFKQFAAGTYLVRIKDTIGCINDSSVEVLQPEKLSIDTTITHNSCYGASSGKILLTVAGGTEPFSYAWSVDRGNIKVLSGLSNGRYVVRVTDAHECKDSLVAEIVYADCCTPFVPTAFTPNGDGRNDLFHIRSKGDMELKQFSIYNRFGQRVYHSTDISDGWNGNFKGAAADVGTYFYYIKVACGADRGHLIDIKGDITLIR